MVEEGETDPEFDAVLATVDPNGQVILNNLEIVTRQNFGLWVLLSEKERKKMLFDEDDMKYFLLIFRVHFPVILIRAP